MKDARLHRPPGPTGAPAEGADSPGMIVPGLLCTEILAAGGDNKIIVRTWTDAGARGCRLCRSGCNASRHAGELALFSCMVWAPPALARREAAAFRCESPAEHHRPVPPRAVEYAKPRPGGGPSR